LGLLVLFVGAPFVVEHIQSFMDQGEEFTTGHLQMVRLHDGLVDLLDQQLAPDFLSQFRMILFQETTPPGQRFNYPLVFQLGIRFGDRIAIDSQFLSQRPDRWE
jgi:hypothetical protein